MGGKESRAVPGPFSTRDGAAHRPSERPLGHLIQKRTAGWRNISRAADALSQCGFPELLDRAATVDDAPGTDPKSIA
jgi:hypothetical protein